MWIRAKPGRNHSIYKKDEYDQKLVDQWETCTKEQCIMLDAVFFTNLNGITMKFNRQQRINLDGYSFLAPKQTLCE
jgi:hypothetical protein